MVKKGNKKVVYREEEEAVKQSGYKLIKWDYSALLVCLWSYSAALCKTALLLESLPP